VRTENNHKPCHDNDPRNLLINNIPNHHGQKSANNSSQTSREKAINTCACGGTHSKDYGDGNPYSPVFGKEVIGGSEESRDCSCESGTGGADAETSVGGFEEAWDRENARE